MELPQDIAARIRTQLEAGDFSSEEDVLRAALLTLEQKQAGLESLREMVREADEDIAAGRIGPFDAEATKQAVRAELTKRGITD